MSKTLPPLPKTEHAIKVTSAAGQEWQYPAYSESDMQAYALAAIEAQGVPDGWKPIETAPESMDECVVVGWLDDEGLPRTEFDYKEDGCWIKWHEHAENTEVIGGHGVSYTPPYTHWLKLPPLASAPPAPQEKQPLTDEQIEDAIYKQCPDFEEWHEGPSIDDVIAIVKAAHGIKGE